MRSGNLLQNVALLGVLWLPRSIEATKENETVIAIPKQPPYTQDEGELWSKNLPYQPVSAFWTDQDPKGERGAYLVLDPFYLYVNYIQEPAPKKDFFDKDCGMGGKPNMTCLCYETNVEEKYWNFLPKNPCGLFAYICFQPRENANDLERVGRTDIPDRYIQFIDLLLAGENVPSTQTWFSKVNVPDSDFSQSLHPAAPQVHLEGRVDHIMTGQPTINYPGNHVNQHQSVRIPPFKFSYGYREFSDIPEPFVKIFTAGCKRDLRVRGVTHGAIYARPYSERLKKTA
ncbi:hypothetical protein L596_025196 [Steinernema carpocapsae]|uniref:Uncharacterized protein n=1 Tax=Steinernema carpocapsae TaxID=34508 RepID=A0A4U5M740_STECR|nr:hypothetical protein L596_025196 [Steinernema carpocapsae]